MDERDLSGRREVIVRAGRDARDEWQVHPRLTSTASPAPTSAFGPVNVTLGPVTLPTIHSAQERARRGAARDGAGLADGSERTVGRPTGARAEQHDQHEREQAHDLPTLGPRNRLPHLDGTPKRIGLVRVPVTMSRC